jgi:hypothetical protein
VYDGFRATSTITGHEWLEEEMVQAKMVSWTLNLWVVPGRRIFEARALTYCSTRGGHRGRSGVSVLTASTLHDSILL